MMYEQIGGQIDTQMNVDRYEEKPSVLHIVLIERYIICAIQQKDFLKIFIIFSYFLSIFWRVLSIFQYILFIFVSPAKNKNLFYNRNYFIFMSQKIYRSMYVSTVHSFKYVHMCNLYNLNFNLFPFYLLLLQLSLLPILLFHGY